MIPGDPFPKGFAGIFFWPKAGPLAVQTHPAFASSPRGREPMRRHVIVAVRPGERSRGGVAHPSPQDSDPPKPRCRLVYPPADPQDKSNTDETTAELEVLL